jgi:galactoside O-acetyltransferase
MTEKLHSGEIYQPSDPEIMRKQMTYLDQVMEYNTIPHSQMERREAMLKKMFAEIGDGCYIESPLHANMGCHFVHFGKNIYANFNLTLVDDTHIYVGDYTMIGPNVTIATAGHPICPELRQKNYQYNAPVTIGRNCWIGAGAILLPGVTVGDNTVIGAGSVVTKDLPSDCVCVGNPCKVLRKVDQRDREYYWGNRPIDWNEI